jgi:hypothetical protein
MPNQETLTTNPREKIVVRWLARTLVAVAIVAGWFIPEFYDWTGADQSRDAPVVGWIAIGVLIADLLLFLLLTGLHFSQTDRSQVVRKRWRFSMLQILLMMTLIAVFLMLARTSLMHIASRGLQAAVVASGIWIAVRFPWTRFRIAWIAFLQIAPFLWVFRKMAFEGYVSSLLAILSSLPVLFPAALFVQPNHEGMQWILTLISTTEFAIGLWASYLGQKRALAFGIVVLTLSIYGSFILNALMRM